MCTRQLGQHSTTYSVFRPPSEHPFTVFRYGGASPLMFLASWLDHWSANGREGAPLFTSFQVLTDGAKQRCPSSRRRATRKDDPGQPAGTTLKTYLARSVDLNLIQLFQKHNFEMRRHSQSWIYLLKAYPQFSQCSEPSFQEIHNFHKQESHTCKKSFCKAFQDFQNQLFNPFNQLFKRANRLASSWVSLKAWSNWL